MLGCHDMPANGKTSLADPLAVTRTPADADLQAGDSAGANVVVGMAVASHPLAQTRACGNYRTRFLPWMRPCGQREFADRKMWEMVSPVILPRLFAYTMMSSVHLCTHTELGGCLLS